MPSIAAFIRKTPVSSLRTYFEHTGVDLPIAVNWSAPDADVVRPLLQAVDEMSDEARSRVRIDAERVNAMADEVGQVALYGVIDDRAVLDDLGNGHARALWIFLKKPTEFRRAEEARYTDEKRRGRYWDGFVSMPGRDLRQDAASLEAFTAALRIRFASNNVHVDIFERTRSISDGTDFEIIQIAIYREGLPDDRFAFNNAGVLERRPYRPVFEAALTYEPATGVIEVVANVGESRAELAHFLTRDLLGIEFRGQKVPLRKYDLDVLLTPHEFATDPEDGIESVDVKLLRLVPFENNGERLTLECLRNADRTIWSMATERFGPHDPLVGGWRATQAKLTIKLRPKGEARRGKTIPLTITMSGCNLREQTEAEQLIGEKYLRRWGILSEVESGDTD
ncbi:hypothetical protein ASD50_11720 [Mesorhizobium sp. Root552]|uniref:hypothetical protein n=1 Tax=Mesorhizobium sp. Root552 TaxID=1736555 RepID=UPI0006F82CF3|nr:hypothetical protein [Mesorhizobium sp. Root552]KQZ12420.1 hypothetical protein ASD50_11720 [Mesorhizobium sp. Root552]